VCCAGSRTGNGPLQPNAEPSSSSAAPRLTPESTSNGRYRKQGADGLQGGAPLVKTASAPDTISQGNDADPNPSAPKRPRTGATAANIGPSGPQPSLR
jgi:hypothetical protein